MATPTRPVVLAGIKHCGKSTLGRFLARRWGIPMTDTDETLEAEFFRRTGRNAGTRAIFLELGEEEFRRFEAETVRALAATPGLQVIALGGGVVSNRFVQEEALRALGLGVWLDIRPEIAYPRVLRRGLPPFLASAPDPRAEFLRICREREPKFREFAELRFPIDEERPAAEVAAELAELIEKGIES
ncbi:MAG: shikimate kinase [Lentisphaeria bacterium]|nr:shikimate kinase [Lentisphaeria bacterium]